MLKLRRGEVVSIEEPGEGVARLTVRVGDEQRAAIAYPGLTGPVEAGDEVVVNVESQDLGLGSGGFDIVCVNLTQGLEGEGSAGGPRHEAELHAAPALRVADRGRARRPAPSARDSGRHHRSARPARARRLRRSRAARAGCADRVRADRGRCSAGRTLGRGARADRSAVYSRTTSPSRPASVASMRRSRWRERSHAGVENFDWDAAVVGPGPGILGSASALGNGGLEALHSAHSVLALGCPVDAGAPHFQRRSARAPPRAQPPHGHRASSC